MKEELGVLVLESRGGNPGPVFHGRLFGAPVSASTIRASARKGDRGYGEVVFNTSMTGYQEILTDPSYYGEIVCMTYPHIGNTGINAEDIESGKLWGAGLVIHELTERASNWRSTEELDHYLKKNQIPGIQGIDTRALTRTIRSQGALRGVILPAHELPNAQALLKELPAFEGRDLISEVTTPEPFNWPSSPPGNKALYKIVAFDFGMKRNQLRSLAALGCEIDVVPATSSAEEVLSRKPDGVFLSNGPGDPAAATYAVKAVRELLGKTPIFGVCMGHQILSLALGAKTYKLKFGHRGANQPVQDLTTGRVEITSQNHGYAVDDQTLPKTAKVSHINLNDRTVEGITVPSLKAFSVQYHPEACPGPHDSAILFERFVECIKST